MRSSESINEISTALAAAQGELEPAPFDKVNPHLKSKYASLSSCRQSSKAILARHGLSVPQFPVVDVQQKLVGVVTRLSHKSGQWFEEVCWCSPKSLNPQDVGSAITYLKRYGYSAAIGQVSDDDDDGNQAQGLNNSSEANARLTAAPQPKPSPVAPTPKQDGVSIRNMDYVIPVGKFKGKKFPETDLTKLPSDVDWWEQNGKVPAAKEYVQKAREFLVDLQPGDDPF